MQQPIQYQLQTINVIDGTSLQGYLEAKYSDLVKVFGKPFQGSGDGKTNNEWVLNIEGVIVTIYDYKENYQNENTEKWHVGSKVKAGARLVNDLFTQELNK